MNLTKSPIENQYNLQRENLINNTGNEKYTDNDRKNYAFMRKFYKENRTLKSNKVIHADFKNKKIIKGVSREFKKHFNNKGL